MIYLDNAATSFPKPEAVYQALDHFARQRLANPGRAGHKMALAAEHALDDGRHLLNQLFHGKEPERFVFTLNCTDALNMAFKGVLDDGDHVITTNLEHNSVSRPLRTLELAGRISAHALAPTAAAPSTPTTSARPSRRRTRLIALTHASNVLGTVQPSPRSAASPANTTCSSWWTRPRRPASCPSTCRSMNIDLLAFPGHKSLLGPTGTGVLYVGPRSALAAWREGGTGGDSSSETQPRELPYFLEGGTPNVLGVAGLAAGIKYVQEQGLEKIHAHEVDTGRATVAAAGRDWTAIEVFGHRDQAGASARSASAVRRCRRRNWAAFSTRHSTSPFGPGCTARRTSIARWAPSPMAPCASAPALSPPKPTSIIWRAPWPRSRL